MARRLPKGGPAISPLVERWAKRLLDPDALLIRSMSSAVEAASLRYALRADPQRYKPGQPLKLLLAGYAGTRNTGGDVRVEEIIRQFRRVLGDRNLELSLFTIDPALTAGYFRTVRQVPLPTVFPKFLYDECTKHHGVVACEGSMFKSKFANALSTMMAGAMAIAAVEGKLSVGYGGEAGAMDEVLEDFVRKHLQQSLVICRNQRSKAILDGLGVRTTVGTDTAWTFEGAPEARAQQLLRQAGWDGRARIVALCPVNPFWWPAKPDLLKAVALKLGGQYREQHYKDVVFHSWSEDADRKYRAYVAGLAEAFEIHVSETRAFPILVGSERLDRAACEAIAGHLSFGVPRFISDEYDMYDLVALLRQCSLLVSSRFHAIVNAMPAGVPAIGVAIDERIENLLRACGHGHYLLWADANHLGEQLLSRMRTAHKDAEAMEQRTLSFVPVQLEAMALMAMDFEDELMRLYPDFPFRSGPRTTERYLPELSTRMRSLMERFS